MLKIKGEILSDKYLKLDINYKNLIKEKDRLKMKNIRMSNFRKVSMITNKTCKNCSLEYKDSENFNWSCRTHQSEWGGAVWWCCGKTN